MSINLLKTSLELAQSSDISHDHVATTRSQNVKKIFLKFSKRNGTKNKISQEKKKNQIIRSKLDKTQKALNRLKKPCLDKKITNIILDRENKPKPEEFIPVKEPEGTVFTEEDFINFEKELKNEV